MNVNSNGYTYGFATILVVLVAVILASLAMGLKPYQQANVTKEKKQNILQSIGLDVDSTQVRYRMASNHWQSIHSWFAKAFLRSRLENSTESIEHRDLEDQKPLRQRLRASLPSQ